MSAYVRLPVPRVESLEYWVDGKKVSSKSTVPFAESLSLTEGSHALDVRVYANGTLRARRAYALTLSGGRVAVNASERLAPPYATYLTDVTSHWAQGDVEAASASGVVRGYRDHTCPITRGEIAVLAVRSLDPAARQTAGLQAQAPTTGYTDDALVIVRRAMATLELR